MKAQIHLYQQEVRSSIYPAIMTRPDIVCAVSKLCEHLQNPGPKHLEAVEYVIRFLYGTATLAIEYSRDYKWGIKLAIRDEHDLTDIFMVASNAAFANNLDHKSTQGYLMKLFGGAID